MTQAHPEYVAVTGDLVRSREQNRARRSRTLERVDAARALLNERFSTDLAIPFAPYGGDGFEALLHRPDAIPELMWEFTTTIRDADKRRSLVRLGFGFGEIYTPLSANPEAVDGPAFHRAREAVEGSRRNERDVRFLGFGEIDDQVLNSITWVMEDLRNSWTDVRARIMRLLNDNRKQVEIATITGSSAQNISNHKRDGKWDLYRDLTDTLSHYLRSRVPPAATTGVEDQIID